MRDNEETSSDPTFIADPTESKNETVSESKVEEITAPDPETEPVSPKPKKKAKKKKAKAPKKPKAEKLEPLEGYDEILKSEELRATSGNCPRRPCFSGATDFLDRGSWSGEKNSKTKYKNFEIRECRRCGGRFAREL